MPQTLWHITFYLPGEQSLLRGRGDFISAVNRLALAFVAGPASVCAFVLTERRMELIAEGSFGAVSAAFVAWKRTYGMHYSSKYGELHPLRRGEWRIRRQYGTEEILRTVGRMYGRVPHGWPWSTFAEHFGRGVRWPHVHIPLWRARRILGTHGFVPESWTITPEGQILLSDFVRTGSLDSLIGSYPALRRLVSLFTPPGE